MSDFLMRLAERALGTAPAVQPLFGSRFGDDAGGGSGFTDVDAEHEPVAFGLSPRPAALPAGDAASSPFPSPSPLATDARGAGNAGESADVPALSRTSGPVLQRYAASGNLPATAPSIAPPAAGNAGAAGASAGGGDAGVDAARSLSPEIGGGETDASAAPFSGDVASGEGAAAPPLVPLTGEWVESPARAPGAVDQGFAEDHVEVEAERPAPSPRTRRARQAAPPADPPATAPPSPSAGAAPGAEPGGHPLVPPSARGAGPAARPARGEDEGFTEVHAEIETVRDQPGATTSARELPSAAPGAGSRSDTGRSGHQETASGDSEQAARGRGRAHPVAPLAEPRGVATRPLAGDASGGDVDGESLVPLSPSGAESAARAARGGEDGFVEVHAEIDAGGEQPSPAASARSVPSTSLDAGAGSRPKDGDAATSGDEGQSTVGRGRAQPITPIMHPRTPSPADDGLAAAEGRTITPPPASDAAGWGEIASEVDIEATPTQSRRSRAASGESESADPAFGRSDAGAPRSSAAERPRSAADGDATPAGLARSSSAENAGEAGAHAGQGSARAGRGGTSFAEGGGAEDEWLVPVGAERSRREADGDPRDGFEIVGQEVEGGRIARSSRTTVRAQASTTTGDTAAARAASAARETAARTASTETRDKGDSGRTGSARPSRTADARGVPPAEPRAAQLDAGAEARAPDLREQTQRAASSRAETTLRATEPAAASAPSAPVVPQRASSRAESALRMAETAVPSAPQRAATAAARPASITRSPAREAAPARASSAESRTGDGDARTADAPGTALAPRPRSVPVAATLASLPTRTPAPQPQQPERPIVHVTIGRIEVRASTPPPAPQPQPQAAPAWTPPVLTLDEYLKRGGSA